MSRIVKADLGSAADWAGLDTPMTGRFRRVIRLGFATGGVAQRAENAPGSVLTTHFFPRQVDALAPGAPEPAVLQQKQGHLTITLPRARRIYRVRLKSPVAGDRLAAFRFDGDVVSEDPVSTAVHGSHGAQIDVTDAGVLLKRVNMGEFALSEGDIDTVMVRYEPVNPRLSLSLVGGFADTPFPVQTDEEGLPVFPALAARGADFAATMSALLSGLPSPLPDPLELDLILSADQPCAARIDALDVRIVLETPAIAEKSILRFSGGVRETKELPLNLPPDAQYQGGSLSLVISGIPSQQIAPSDYGPPVPTASGEGIRITEKRPVATRITLGAATVIVRAEAVLAAPDAGAELFATLYQDLDGHPGAALAESEIIKTASARMSSLAFSFPPTALPAGPVWFGLSSVSGTAVALLGEAGQVATGVGASFVLMDGAAERGLAVTLHPVVSAGMGQNTGPGIEFAGTRLLGVPVSGPGEIDLESALSPLAATGAAALRITSATRAVVTIDPPLLRYTIPD